METKRALLAIILSIIILVGYQKLFMPVPAPAPQPQPAAESATPPAEIGAPTAEVPVAAKPPVTKPVVEERPARKVTVETALYTAVFTEDGGGLVSLRLHHYRETVAKDSPPKELVTTSAPSDLPLALLWNDGSTLHRPFLAAERQTMTTTNGEARLVMRGSLTPGIEIVRTLTFHDDRYLIDMTVEVVNRSAGPVVGSPIILFTNRPFSKEANRFLFTGPAVLQNGELVEIKTKDLEEGVKTFTGPLQWAAYEGPYFLCGVIPRTAEPPTVEFRLVGPDTVRTRIGVPAVTLAPGASKQYQFAAYTGPKEIRTLEAADADLARAVNFGFWDFLAKPTLHLLNFLYRYVHNYGVAIILVTILIKLLFWPIAQKGMKSMKTMQKLQPKMAKLREKYADDRERLNQEMMQLYKTYKVNPLSGCLPMFLQIPVFFALYKVLLQTIELRHAPFILWINDLSAPDRLPIGIDIPYLGGIPVLTLLMGGSMYLQQRMTPSTGDPTQQKVMQFLPIIFTFMFLNFASGLVLYWLVNNLLSIAQQYMINRQIQAEEQG